MGGRGKWLGEKTSSQASQKNPSWKRSGGSFKGGGQSKGQEVYEGDWNGQILRLTCCGHGDKQGQSCAQVASQGHKAGVAKRLAFFRLSPSYLYEHSRRHFKAELKTRYVKARTYTVTIAKKKVDQKARNKTSVKRDQNAKIHKDSIKVLPVHEVGRDCSMLLGF
eukprot:1160997-Pelagomonas_calceolata.AAC.16